MTNTVILQYRGRATFLFAISINGKTYRFDPLNQTEIELPAEDAFALLAESESEWLLKGSTDE